MPYWASVAWIQGCETDVGWQSPGRPLSVEGAGGGEEGEGATCRGIMEGNVQGCKSSLLSCGVFLGCAN